MKRTEFRVTVGGFTLYLYICSRQDVQCFAEEWCKQAKRTKQEATEEMRGRRTILGQSREKKRGKYMEKAEKERGWRSGGLQQREIGEYGKSTEKRMRAREDKENCFH